ncbi:beta-glucosidase [Leadbetterella byssophila]|nr:beta-glucosidase [Leadbetterella byssophila]
MTLEEKVDLLVGAGMPGFGGPTVGQTENLVPGAAGTTKAIPRLGIPAIVLADGPAGIRISPTRQNDTQTFYATAFPIATLIASSWNLELAENIGKAMGKEALEYGADVLLAPALNLHRHPLNGRNFEYYSEDPIISGKMTAAAVNGIQSNGVGTSIKHFAANNQESLRSKNDVRIKNRTLRELYLKGFEIAVKESSPWTVMSSYNKINGTYTSESRELLTTVLRDEWKFDGIVMTDWFGGTNIVKQVHAGNDLLMPGIKPQKDAILQNVKDGKLDVKDVDVNVRRILDLILKTPRFKKYPYSNKPDLKAHALIAREAAAEGMILLKNEKLTLPISSETKIAAFGVTSYDFISGGTGSGDVNEAYIISLMDGLSAFSVERKLAEKYSVYVGDYKEKNKPDPNNPMAAFLNKPRMPELELSESEIGEYAKSTDMAIITIGRNSGEFEDRKTTNDFYLSDEEQNLISKVAKAYHSKGKKVVVILNVGGVIETASWKEKPDAILLAWQAGQEGGNSVADILSGKVGPSGKLTMSFPNDLKDVASNNNFPIDIELNFQEMMGGGPPNSAQEPRKNLEFTTYEEDLHVGYRDYITNKKQVSFPFGFGLSYTSFDFRNSKISGDSKVGFTLKVTVKNTGKAKGKEIVQIYRSNLNKDPDRELISFGKTKELAPGEVQILTFKINSEDFSIFDESINAWVTKAGNYHLLIGKSVSDIILTENVEIKEKFERRVIARF